LIDDLRVRPGEIDSTGATNETADPRGHFTLRSSMDLPHDIELNAALRWVDALHVDDGPTGGPMVGIVPSYFELDSKLAWYPLPRLQLSIVGQNLLHAHHPEYGYPDASREEIERSVFGKVSWEF
jgi:iron complex outermembrane receptor protein